MLEKVDTEFHLLTQPFFFEDTRHFSIIEKSSFFSSNCSLSSLQLILEMSLCHAFRSICVHGGVLKQSRRYICFREGLAAHPFARNTTLSWSDDTVPTLTIAAPLDSGPTAQTKPASMPHSVQFSNDSAVSNNFLNLSLDIYYHSLSLLLKDTAEKLGGCKEEFKRGRRQRKIFVRQYLVARR